MVEQDRFTAAVRLGRYVAARKIEALRLELIRAVPRDEVQAPYEVGPPIAPLHR